MTKFEQTYNWLKPIFERLMQAQEENSIIIDGMEIIGKIGIDEKEKMIFAYQHEQCARLLYYGKGWTDHETETKKYWQEKLGKWKIAYIEDVKGIDLT